METDKDRKMEIAWRCYSEKLTQEAMELRNMER
jgi:hypothetical protein